MINLPCFGVGAIGTGKGKGFGMECQEKMIKKKSGTGLLRVFCIRLDYFLPAGNIKGNNFTALGMHPPDCTALALLQSVL